MSKKQVKVKPVREGSIVVRNAATGKLIAQVADTRRTHIARKESMIKNMVARVTGNMQVAERWYARPNDLLGGRTPEQAVKEGDQDKVVGLLLNAAGQ